jgi:hypothetical protein
MDAMDCVKGATLEVYGTGFAINGCPRSQLCADPEQGQICDRALDNLALFYCDIPVSSRNWFCPEMEYT